MKRREFLALVGGATLAPLVARAQQPMPLVGFLNGGVSSTGVDSTAAFRKGLSEAGLVEGRNVAVEYHWFGGEYDRVPAVIADLIRRRVAVIATPGFPPGALAVKAATSTIPLVFGVGDDPVKLGLVASLARPDGNVTGINFFVHELVTKRLGLMRELVPKAVRIAVVVNPGNAAAAEAEAGCRCAQSSRSARSAGTLMSYGTNVPDMFRQVGIYAGSIVKGAKPADLPVLQSTKFEFAINLQTARALGISVPPTLLARADEVIE